MERLAEAKPTEEQLPSLCQVLSSTTPDGALEVTITCGPLNVSQPADIDAALRAESSRESANQWDRLLAPYAPFGLTWAFNDPDLDGNGLTMWFEGKEVRGIMDEQEQVWITEHAGNGFSNGAVELYAVYTDGRLSGLRLATAEEQAGFDETRAQSSAERERILSNGEEQREFPYATRADYDALLALRTEGYEDLPLEDFNQRLLDWANENTDAWNRISCDVIWDDYAVELLPGDDWAFASFTCRLSGTENGQMIRALHTGNPEEDPGWSRNLPEKFEEEDGIRTAWCDLYYDISYHISNKSAVTVGQRDAAVVGMMHAIDTFWRDTDLDTLLTMTKEDVAARFNTWARESSAENIRINPVTGDNLHFEHADERGID